MPADCSRSTRSTGGSTAAARARASSPATRRSTAPLVAGGYVPVSTTVLLEADLAQPEPRDPRTPLIRRQTQLEFVEDALPPHWWQNLALGEFPLTDARLLAKSDGTVLARASTWDMRWFGPRGRAVSTPACSMSKSPPNIAARATAASSSARSSAAPDPTSIDCVEVQTSAENQPALALYTSLGFVPIDQSTLYRKGASGHSTPAARLTHGGLTGGGRLRLQARPFTLPVVFGSFFVMAYSSAREPSPHASRNLSLACHFIPQTG